MHRATTVAGLALVLLVLPAGCSVDPEDRAADDYFEGVEHDSDHPYDSIGGGKEDGDGYDVPAGLPTLVDPEIIVSLDGLTLHLFDRHTGFSEVFPVGVGVLNGDGVSITPTGHYATGPDTSDGWYYVARRYSPSYFGGFPFIRLNIENSQGQHTYGLHGPITERLIRGYVSHGCMRMEGEDVVRVFYLIRTHASTPVTIQREVEVDAAGNAVDVGSEVALWAVGEQIRYGESVGDPPPRDDTGTDADGCADDRLEAELPVAIEPGTYGGLILCAGDTDQFVVRLEAGETLAAHVHFIHAISDIDLRILGPSGEVLGRSAGSGDDEQVTVSAEEAGDHVVEVYPYGDGDNNGYTLDIEVR